MFYLKDCISRLPCLLDRKVTVFGLTDEDMLTSCQLISLMTGLPPVLPDMKAEIPFHNTMSCLCNLLFPIQCEADADRLLPPFVGTCTCSDLSCLLTCLIRNVDSADRASGWPLMHLASLRLDFGSPASILSCLVMYP